MKICIDAGHGIETAGKRSPDGSYLEYEFNRDVAARIKAHLERCGLQTVLTCTGERDVPLSDRCAISNRAGCELFLSIHTNASGNDWSDVTGWSAHIIARGGKAEQLAEQIRAVAIPLLGCRDRGVNVNNYQVLRDTKCPAVLIEFGFLSNQTETFRMLDPAWQDQSVSAVAEGVLAYAKRVSALDTAVAAKRARDEEANERWRQHYWARNHVGWRYPARAVPNAGHHALADLERAGVVTGVLTQNIDLLHVRAGSRHVVHLHGRYDTVRCTACGDVSPIARLHERLEVLNPGWVDRHVDDAEVAPDADAALAATTGFVVAGCERCGGVLRTDVVFFGDSVPADRVEAARDLVDSAGAVLVAGSSLAVRSALRWVRRAHADGKP
ncbi:MAG: hypothetical protein EOM69_07055, partial [Clostridia bacterium]|nr:hypothetical protein [Clostridia bacterium]